MARAPAEGLAALCWALAAVVPAAVLALIVIGFGRSR